MDKIITIGLDIAKQVFPVHGVDAAGGVVLSRQLRRGEVLKFLPSCRVAWSAWRRAPRLIIGRARLSRWAMRCA